MGGYDAANKQGRLKAFSSDGLGTRRVFASKVRTMHYVGRILESDIFQTAETIGNHKNIKSLRVLQPADYPYGQTLRPKLHWGEQGVNHIRSQPA
ncbi:hypothetical protein LVJ83_06835 [Uruburuella testudinis]|uniref:Uncharacterized protein n=1 Tax=Uruburuella testudinis TaxID=1282863 RepID=A0ABY4DNZ2_9NEIS|nr:hypothetical protein [Uruburuella testudinis]UOO80708.1 hypothetical protein LVJ83_06835 [Uruburuella testudinis]